VNFLRRNKYLYLGAIILLVYAIIEIFDCLTLILICLSIIPNFSINLDFVFPEIKQLFVFTPINLVPMVLSFTFMRIISTIGLFKNRLWGFWIAILSLTTTMIWDILIIPIGFYELLGCTIISILLIIGYFEDNKLIEGS
jgi:hypothetical protein